MAEEKKKLKANHTKTQAPPVIEPKRRIVGTDCAGIEETIKSGEPLLP